MADIPAIGANSVSLPEVQLKSQRTMREIRAHAAVAAGEAESAEMRAAFKRLSRALASGQPLRADVPRGYYLNFTV
jgi:hypothetical protein